MATIKSYTDLSQSKKLAEILPPESADMHYGEYCVNGEHYPIPICDDDYNGHCCWSLAVLLDVLPNGIVMNKDSQSGRYHFSFKYIETYVSADNPVDACVAMIEKLHELNLL